MNGLKTANVETFYDISIPDRGLEDRALALELGLEKSLFRVRAGVSSRARVSVQIHPKNIQAELFQIEFYLEAGSCVDVFYQLPDGYSETNLKVTAKYYLKKHASLNFWVFLGDSRGKVRHEVVFMEPHGFASMNGLSLLAGHSDLTHELVAEHQAPFCISRQFYKSIVTQQAKTAFESLVYVSVNAEKSDSKQLNKNLILSDQAMAVSRPELKIETDDVSCAHGSATGELDQAQLFYLKSRGIDSNTAHWMMIWGFAGEVLENVPDFPLKQELGLWVESRIREMIQK